MSAGQKIFNRTPPAKGSFPLDHEGECKQFMTKYMQCLKESNNKYSLCQEESKQYLQCRMDRDLMAKEDLSKLGFREETKSDS